MSRRAPRNLTRKRERWRASCYRKTRNCLGLELCQSVRQITRSLLTEKLSSIHSTKSPLALNTTETLMRKILTRYQVDPNFLSVLFSFGEIPHLAESGSSNIASTASSDGSQSKVACLVQLHSVLNTHKRSRTRFDTPKRTTDRRIGPGL